MKKAGLATRDLLKGLPTASAPETEADRTPRESLLARMIANGEPSNQSFETDREATVCTSEPSLLAVLRRQVSERRKRGASGSLDDQQAHPSLCQQGDERHRGNQINPVFG